MVAPTLVHAVPCRKRIARHFDTVIRLFAGAFAGCICLLPSPALPRTSAGMSAADRCPRVAGEILVKMRAAASPAALPARSAAVRKSSAARVSRGGLWRMPIPAGLTEEEAAAELRAEAPDLVEYAEPNYIIHAEKIPDDPLFGELYALAEADGRGDIDARAAWEILTGGEVPVAVVDSGIDYEHEDLAANIWTNHGEVPGNGIDDDGNGFVDDVRGWDFFSGDNAPGDAYGHGTHVAGIIGAAGDNGRGVTGVGWKARLIPLRFMGPDGAGSLGGAVQAIDYAAKAGARVISCSWGLNVYSQALEDAIRAADAAGAIVVAAAGNSSSDNDAAPIYPSSSPSPNVISVAATDRNGNLAWFSCWGPQSVDIAAPGDEILSTVPGGGYRLMSGTSMAAPHVSGAAALAWARTPGASNTEIISEILDGAETLAPLRGMVRTSGRLNLYRTLSPGTVEPPPVTDPDLHSVSLVLNGNAFSPGGRLELSAIVGAGAQSAHTVCDGYVAALLPGGRLFFLAPGGRWSPSPVPIATGLGVTDDMDAQVGAFPVTESLPSGPYAWYAVLTAPGAGPLDGASRTSNLAHTPFAVVP